MDVLLYVCLAPTGVGYAHQWNVLTSTCSPWPSPCSPWPGLCFPLAQSLLSLAQPLLHLAQYLLPWPSPCSPGPAPVSPGPGERTANPSRKSSLLHGHETTWLSISLPLCAIRCGWTVRARIRRTTRPSATSSTSPPYFPSTSGFSSQYFPFVNQVTWEEIEESNVLELSTDFPSRNMFSGCTWLFWKYSSLIRLHQQHFDIQYLRNCRSFVTV